MVLEMSTSSVLDGQKNKSIGFGFDLESQNIRSGSDSKDSDSKDSDSKDSDSDSFGFEQLVFVRIRIRGTERHFGFEIRFFYESSKKNFL
jgi:hypothetical protein